MNECQVKISVVIPAYNEAKSINALFRQLESVLTSVDKQYEVIFIDDGSTDHTFAELKRIVDVKRSVKVIQLRRNFGKAAALTAGFREAKGEVVITMDADLQDDPREIPHLLAALSERPYDLVSGWKFPRRDPLSKTLPSRLFNLVTALMTGVRLHDFNCGFKAYRRQVIKEISIYGELYRYIPVLAHWRGFRVGEIKIQHHPRKFGRSKFGASRFFRGFFDLLTVLFLTRYKHRPLHLFGGMGILSFIIGTIISVYLTFLWLKGERPIGNRPLLTLGVLLITVGVQLFTLGLLAEMLTNLLTVQQSEYSIRRKIQ